MKQFDLAELGLEHRDVDLHWNRPREILDDDEPSLALPKDARDEKGLYRFVRTHHLQEFDGGTTDRIGIAFDQTLAKRIDQYKPETIHELRSRGRLFLSYSLVGYGGQHRRIVYEDVEDLLCFVVQPIGSVVFGGGAVVERVAALSGRRSRPLETLYARLKFDESLVDSAYCTQETRTDRLQRSRRREAARPPTTVDARRNRAASVCSAPQGK